MDRRRRDGVDGHVGCRRHWSPLKPLPPAPITIAFTGDDLGSPALWPAARRNADGHGLDFRPMLARLRPLIRSADLAICHLETPLSGPGVPPSGSPRYVAPHQLAAAIRFAGYDGCSTASNHTLDAGTAGIRSTLDALDAQRPLAHGERPHEGRVSLDRSLPGGRCGRGPPRVHVRVQRPPPEAPLDGEPHRPRRDRREGRTVAPRGRRSGRREPALGPGAQPRGVARSGSDRETARRRATRSI